MAWEGSNIQLRHQESRRARYDSSLYLQVREFLRKVVIVIGGNSRATPYQSIG